MFYSKKIERKHGRTSVYGNNLIERQIIFFNQAPTNKLINFQDFLAEIALKAFSEEHYYRVLIQQMIKSGLPKLFKQNAFSHANFIQFILADYETLMIGFKLMMESGLAIYSCAEMYKLTDDKIKQAASSLANQEDEPPYYFSLFLSNLEDRLIEEIVGNTQADYRFFFHALFLLHHINPVMGWPYQVNHQALNDKTELYLSELLAADRLAEATYYAKLVEPYQFCCLENGLAELSLVNNNAYF